MYVSKMSSLHLSNRTNFVTVLTTKPLKSKKSLSPPPLRNKCLRSSFCKNFLECGYFYNKKVFKISGAFCKHLFTKTNKNRFQNHSFPPLYPFLKLNILNKSYLSWNEVTVMCVSV